MLKDLPFMISLVLPRCLDYDWPEPHGVYTYDYLYVESSQLKKRKTFLSALRILISFLLKRLYLDFSVKGLVCDGFSVLFLLFFADLSNSFLSTEGPFSMDSRSLSQSTIFSLLPIYGLVVGFYFDCVFVGEQGEVEEISYRPFEHNSLSTSILTRAIMSVFTLANQFINWMESSRAV